MKKLFELLNKLDKEKIRSAAIAAFIFLVGYGTAVSAIHYNYTSTAPKSKEKTKPKTTQVASKNIPEGECPVKGNVGSGKKTYHIPGGASYSRTQPEECFKTEAEARAAGFKKALR